MFRKGGLSQETGIMSGLDRRGYAGGGNIGGGRISGTPMGSRTGFLTPYVEGYNRINWNPTASTTAQNVAKRTLMERLGGGTKTAWDAFKKGAGMARTGIGSLMSNPLTLPVGALAATAASPFIAQAAATGQRKKGLYTPEGESYDLETGEILGGPSVDEMGFTEQELAGSDAFVPSRPMTPKEMEKARKAKIVELQKAQISARIKRGDPVDETEATALGIDITTGEIKADEPDKIPGLDGDELTGDEESDLMKAYKEYLPVMEEALGGRPSTKSQWLALAKFGTGVLAQPGGDLIGAIGKAAQMPLDDLAKLQEKVEDRKTQAKLLAIQSAMKDAEPGALGKAVKDIKKLLNLKGKAGDKVALAFYEKLQKNNTTQMAADMKAYRQQAKDLGVSEEGYAASMEAIKDKYPELVGQFIIELPDKIDDRETAANSVPNPRSISSAPSEVSPFGIFQRPV